MNLGERLLRCLAVWLVMLVVVGVLWLLGLIDLSAFPK